jgi:uncharacterized protein
MNRLKALLNSALALVSRRAALRGAIRRNDIRDAAMLVRPGVPRTSRLFMGDPPLVLASRLGRTRMIRLLVEAGASPFEQRSAAVRAGADAGSVTAVEALIAAVKRSRDSAGEVTGAAAAALDAGLLSAAAAGHTEICRMFLESGACVDARDGGAQGFTSLMYAALTGEEDLTRLLISFGASIDCKAVNSWTPLMMAAEKCHVKVLSALLAAGADPTIRDRRGMTALNSAQLAGCKAGIQLLNSRTDRGRPTGPA